MNKSCLKKFEENLAYHFSEKLNYPFAMPHWIYISLSHRCTYNCQMCGVVKILQGYELPFKIVKDTFDTIAHWRWDCVITLTGGEPFLREDIFKIIEYGVKKKLKIEVISNGALINKGVAEKIIKSGLRNIAISLDGAREETHDHIREKGAFKKAVRALQYLSAAKKQFGRGPQISVWTTIMKENVAELFDIIELVRDIGVECLVYHPVIVAQDDMQNTSPDAPFWVRGDNIRVLKEQIDKIVDYRDKYGLVAFLHDPYLWIKYFENTLTKDDWKCNPFVFINIGPDGEIRSCGSSFGNIKDIGLDACLTTSLADVARAKMKQCTRPCLQTCWARPEADYLDEIVNTFIKDLNQELLPEERKRIVVREALMLLDKYEKLIKNRLSLS
ncbi:radical SAM protein [bacterium]|nr:radical SAM protein [bacterium]